MNRLGIISGWGELPHIAMKEAIATGEDPLFLAIRESNFYPGDFGDRVIPIWITKVGEVIRICKKNKINRLLLLGKVDKEVLFKSKKFDWKAIMILSKMINKHDYSIFKAVLDEFQKSKIEVISQKTFLRSLLLPEGQYTKKKLSKESFRNIEIGMDYAKKMAELDIGQTVVTAKQTVIAVESAEGTDETIRRAGKIAAGKEAAVCKSSKKNQDHRFDIPTIGIQTLEVMKNSGCNILSFQADETFIVTPNELIEYANKNKMSLVSFGDSKDKQWKKIKKLQKKYP